MDIIYEINSIIINIPDFQFNSYIQNNLLITGSHDFCYYHELEIQLEEVYYLSLPSEFYYPLFCPATSDENKLIKQLVAVESKATIYCIEAETTSSIETLPFYIVAEKINFCEGTVYYYRRENLQENEKIADWVKS